MSSGAYNEVQSERDALLSERHALRAKIERLETSNDALSAELAETLDRFEDLRLNHQETVGTVASLRETEAALTEVLTERSEELEKTEAELAKAAAELERLTSTYTSLMSDLEAEVAAGQIQIEQLREGIRVNVSDEILFASGSAQLDGIGRKVLEKVIKQLARLDHTIEVQGHTDNRPIRGSLAKRYPTNWELAAARASRVVRLMQENGIDGERLRVVSLASFRPIASNDTPEDRSLNRRIEIRLQPREGGPIAEVPATGKAPVAKAGGGASGE